MMPTLTFDDSVVEEFIGSFGWKVADEPEGLIVDEEEEPVKDFHGHNITVHQFCGVVADEGGEPVPLRDSFPAFVDYIAWKRENDRRTR